MSKTCAPRYRVCIAQSEPERARAEELRHRCFRGGGGRDQGGGRDHDQFDDRCRHVLIERCEDGALLACYRLMLLTSGAEITQSYSAQFYDLSALSKYPAPLAELGRFCIAPEIADGGDAADILRMAWAELTRFVDDHQVEMLFGCSSFRGVDPDPYRDSFALLQARHLAPEALAPKLKPAQDVDRGAESAEGGGSAVFAQSRVKFSALRPAGNPRLGLKTMPPMLRSYLVMGGWVSDHAVVDRDLGTLHVFTGLEISAVPAARARLMRGLLG